jgi:hypothetical protein
LTFSSSAVGKYYLNQPTVTKYDLKNPEYSEKSLEELRVIGKKTTIVFSEEHVKEVFSRTKDQSRSNDWHRHR